LKVKLTADDLKGYTVHIAGIVQGIGMRPFIFKAADRFKLGGRVSNQGSAVVIELEGSKKCIGQFLTELLHNPPPGGRICSIRVRPRCYIGYDSSESSDLQGFIPPDAAICSECLKELQDRKNPRYSYAFTNCTCCGPRYSIIKALPYDRVNTTMSSFIMCDSCRSEYENPNSRRFHAQTNCCPECGPQLSLVDSRGIKLESANPIDTVRGLLCQGKLVAIKGIGGYHLVCNALDDKAVKLLRQRKRRPDRPLAVMAAGINAVKLICTTTLREEEVLEGRQHPIVLLEKRPCSPLPYSIAPGLSRLGVMLPYTPMHHLLFDDNLKYLVMTSGNISGMPICYKNEDALERLKDAADYFLIHNREILVPLDDSVVRVVDGKEMVSRCARGYAPAVLGMKADAPVIAMGAEQKASFCMLQKGYAHTSQYLGNLEDMDTCTEYLQTMERMKVLLQTNPKIIVHDMHPGYFSTQYASRQSCTRLAIQHHHAHMAACMAEHGLAGEIIGVIYDGTGAGTDGAVWGGEFFIGSRSRYIRAGHWKYVTLQGGDSVIKEPWKCAAAYLYAMGIDSRGILNSVDASKIKLVEDTIKHNINCFKSSSMGRFFDCVSAIVTKRTRATYDSQAAIELESVADTSVLEYYNYYIHEKEDKLEIGYEKILSGILKDLKTGKPASYISVKYHNTVCEATIDCVCRLRAQYGLNDIALSGGVFENTYLLTAILKGLKSKGFNVYWNMQAPINDGGISLGQAAAAAEMVKEVAYVPGCTGKDCFNT
jgi:hydrogenase maturation protein HypF